MAKSMATGQSDGDLPERWKSASEDGRSQELQHLPEKLNRHIKRRYIGIRKPTKKNSKSWESWTR
jgi:hypothetical protein